MHGLAVTTVEGIGSSESKLHPVQERIAKAHGSQCGFCTPGIVMSMYALLRNKTKIEEKDIETAFQGNLCRCTGYRPIIEGFKTFMEAWEKQYVIGDIGGDTNSCIMGKECCRNKETDEVTPKLYNKSSFQPYDPTQEPIFPPELKLNMRYHEEYVYFKSERVVWLRPQNLEELIAIKNTFPSSKIVIGNTELGVEMKFKKLLYPVLVSPALVKEMNFCTITNKGIEIGATTTLADVEKFLKSAISKNFERSKVLEAIKDMLHWFAGTQVRNVASLVGNIMTASPISDLNPILMASSAVLNVRSLTRGRRKIVINETFFKGYRKTSVEDDEVVTSVEIPFTTKTQSFKAYKQAKRKEDDISIVTAAFNVKFEDNSFVVKQAKLCFGGMGPTTRCAVRSSELMKGLKWNNEMLSAVCDSLVREFELDISVPGGMAEYRKSLCVSFLFRFYIDVIRINKTLNRHSVPSTYLSAATEEPTLPWQSSQYFEIIDNNRKVSDAVGKPIPHMSANKQACGEALYCDDVPHFENELYLTLVFSTEPHAEIISIDATKALSVPGVVAFFSASDIDENCNKLGPIFEDEEIFSSKIVTSRSCVIGAVIAESESAARKGKDQVIVKYNSLTPVIISIEEAIHHKSFYSSTPRVLKKGNVADVFKNTKLSNTVEGRIRTGAQEHFYLETISAFAIRKEDELEVISSTQNPAEVGVCTKYLCLSKIQSVINF